MILTQEQTHPFHINRTVVVRLVKQNQRGDWTYQKPEEKGDGKIAEW